MGIATVPQSSSRSKRGYYLWREAGEWIIPKGNGKFLVPGVGADFYEVDLAEESCNCPDFTNRHEEISEETGYAFWCKHMYAAMVFTIKHPEIVDEAEANPTGIKAEEKAEKKPSRCAGCGVPSGKPSEGGAALSGKGPNQPLYCMDCNPAFMSRAQAGAALEKMAEKAGVA